MRRGFLLDAQRDLINHWYQETPMLKAVQIHRRLEERGVGIDYTTVVKYTREFRKKSKGRIYWPLEFLPGEEGQVDWFFVNHPRLGKLCGFALILSYSRYLFAHLFPRSSFEFFIEGHLMALRSFGGCPHALRYDNLKSVVIRRDPITYNSAFMDFAHHFGFEIRLCNVAAGNEKGRVERVIRTMRGTFFNDASNHQSLKALNSALHEWVDQKNHTVHRTTLAQPTDKMKEEKLKPLPDGVWNNVINHPPKKPNKLGLVTFDTNSYSYPDYLSRCEIIVRSSVDRVDLLTLDQQKVASHPRSFERMKNIINPIHRTINRLSTRAKRERVLSVIRNLDPVVTKFIDSHGIVGEDPYVEAYELLKLLRLNSKTVLISAVREALTKGSPRIAYVRALLEPTSTHTVTDVLPQDQRILDIDYKARSLEEYDDDSDN